MRSMLLMMTIAAMVSSGCASMKNAPARGAGGGMAETCGKCHPDQYASWQKTPHADQTRMRAVKDTALRQCDACHELPAAHADDPAKPTRRSPSGMTRSEQNAVCGKCHFDNATVKTRTVNPRNRHGLIMSVGFEGFKRQISCLDCHKGHSVKADMLKSIRAHTCFQCHKEAVVTMGVFQPVNYLTAGKTCVSCHPSHGGPRSEQAARMTAGMVVTCIICHPTGDLHKTGF